MSEVGAKMRVMSYFAQELASQPDSWRQAQRRRDEAGAILPPQGARVAILGCGTSLYVAQAVAHQREAGGHGQTDVYPASEVPSDRAWDAVVALSRSGTTTEVIDAVQSLRPGTPVLTVTATAGSPLEKCSSQTLLLDFADERSVVQTRFATTTLALLLGHYGWDVEASTARAERHLAEQPPAWAAEVEQFVFLGRGVGAALANEAALKFREVLRTWSEAYPTREFRHGPISALGQRSLVWLLDSAEPSIDEQIARTGARVVRSAEGDPLAELVRVHRFAEALVQARGIDPDDPPHLTRSVVLSESN